VTPFLLHKAYPRGFLAMRGVLTVGGWTSLGKADTPLVKVPGTMWWHPDPNRRCGALWEGWPQGSHKEVVAALAAGDLLPLVDPAETATWACLLADLAEAAFGEPGTDGLRIRPSSGNGDRWTIMGSSAPAPKTGNRMGLSVVMGIVPTLDPALALVRMRIVFRENEALLTGDKTGNRG